MASVNVSTSAAVAVAEPGGRNYARILEQTWIWSIVGYSLLRFFIAWGAFAEHGANIWVFSLIDVGTAWPYAKSVASVCKRAARSEWRGLPLPLVVAVTTFFAPYAYLWVSAGEMPDGVRVAMVICVSVLLMAASVGVLTKTRKLRREARTTMIERTGAAEASVGLARGGNDPAFFDLRAGALSPDDSETASQSAIVIDLADDVDFERPATTY